MKNNNQFSSSDSALIARLPTVRGRYSENVDMSLFTWFRVGGMAEVIFRPADLEDLSGFLENKKEKSPVTVIGATSNLLVRDGGIPGVVIRLGKPFSNIVPLQKSLRVGSAALNSQVSRAALRADRTGLEFLSGIPGTIGGGLRMNAGSYGSEFKDILIEAEIMDPFGNVHVLSVDELGFKYRQCSIDSNWIFLSALFKAPLAEPDEIKSKIENIRLKRIDSQPIKEKTGGSTFSNPQGHKAWQLIEAAGCRGKRLGAAMISKKHCNFLINTGKATARELEELGNLVRCRVFDNSGVKLDWEIKRIGLTKKFHQLDAGTLK
ncbi:MAG: UDP-N-acetylenolpyruvoylglucosamine reductase [Rhodospirillaceae bacterium]|nr:UDP-N-acetylenolpyruvoylglucosamine reductase [Rhodospirillaceae bacterium]